MRKILEVSSCLLSVLLSSCASPPLLCKWTPEEVSGKPVILFVPGLYGSALADEATGDRIFLNFSNALWSSKPLALQGKHLGIDGAMVLRSDGMMEGISVVPGLYTIDFYGGSYEHFLKKYGDKARVIAFSYDWRQDDFQSVHELAVQIKSLRSAGAKSITLIGHSLGATIAAFYLRYGDALQSPLEETWEGAKWVDSAVIASPVFRGAMRGFADMYQGVSLGFSKVPLSATSLGSFPSYYQFIPPKSGKLVSNHKFENAHDYVFKKESWEEWKGGLFSGEFDTKYADERRLYTESCLKTAERFSSLMLAPPKVKNRRPIPVLLGIGKGEPTLAKAVRTEKEGWVFTDERYKELFPQRKDSLFEDGDGLVTVASAKAPEAFAENLHVEEFQLKMPHRGMFTQSAFQEKIAEFLAKHSGS